MRIRPFSVVCAVDFAESSPAVIEHALDEAHRHVNAAVSFISVLETGSHVFSHSGPSLAELEETDTQLRRLVQEILPAFSDSHANTSRNLHFHTRSGKPDEEIVELGYESRADRIVVGRHGARRRREGMGSIAARVVQAAPCTVHVIQHTDYEGAQEDYSQCQKCVNLREDTGGEEWFCKEHSTGRAPRLMRSIGVTTPTPGWGIF